jgi:hypothetical protein
MAVFVVKVPPLYMSSPAAPSLRRASLVCGLRSSQELLTFHACRYAICLAEHPNRLCLRAKWPLRFSQVQAPPLTVQ